MCREKKKHACVVCGHRTLEERGDWEICPVCFWEDDVLVEGVDKSSPANGGMMVSTAQANFVRYGAISPDLVGKTRPPHVGEEKDPGWKPLPEAIQMLAKAT